MTETSRTMPPGGARKRARSEAELAEAAARFAGSWVAGDSVQTWLNWHEGRCGELSELLFRGWSWADIGLALFRAGICYGTGRPIPATTLQVKASQARSKARRQREPETHEQAREPARPSPPPAQRPARSAEPPSIETPPAAAPASPLQPSVPVLPVPPAAGPRPQRVRRTQQEVDALIARALAKKPSAAAAERTSQDADAMLAALSARYPGPAPGKPAAPLAKPAGAGESGPAPEPAAPKAEPAPKEPEVAKPTAADYWRSIGKTRPGS